MVKPTLAAGSTSSSVPKVSGKSGMKAKAPMKGKVGGDKSATVSRQKTDEIASLKAEITRLNVVIEGLQAKVKRLKEKHSLTLGSLPASAWIIAEQDRFRNEEDLSDEDEDEDEDEDDSD